MARTNERSNFVAWADKTGTQAASKLAFGTDLSGLKLSA
jgi:hypothetical protein